MIDISHVLGNAKLWWALGDGIVLLLADKKFAPSEQDLPVPLKTILAVLCIAEIYVLLQRQPVGYVDILYPGAGVLLIAALYVYFKFVVSYKKQATIPPPKWKFWSNVQQTVELPIVGGRLIERARDKIRSESMSVQEYFKTVAFDEDMVWSRWSRGLAQAMLLLLYAAFILSAAACLVMATQATFSQ
jgi:Ca2+/Na+ antiporter